MSMPRSRWSLLAAISSVLLLAPASPANHASLVQRGALIPDGTFELPDSVRALLTRVTRLVVAPDSSLYLADWRIPAILHLEPSGEFRRVLGRAGGGPGEFTQVIGLGIYRDSLWAMDPGQVRLTFFPLSGEGTQTLSYGPYAARSTVPGLYSRRGLPAAIFPDGSLLLEEQAADPSRSTNGLLLRVDRTMRILDTVAPLASAHSSMVFNFQDGGSVINQPYSDDPVYAVSVDGSMVVLVSRRVATNEEEAEFTVTALQNGNRQLYRRTIQYQPRRLSSRVTDSMMTMLYGLSQPTVGPKLPLTLDSLRRQMFRPSFYPPVASVRVGRDGTTWLKVNFADSPGKADEWMQLSPRGLPIRRVTAPRGFQLLEADRRTVWGSFADSMDVPEVRRYALEQNPIN